MNKRTEDIIRTLEEFKEHNLMGKALLIAAVRAGHEGLKVTRNDLSEGESWLSNDLCDIWYGRTLRHTGPGSYYMVVNTGEIESIDWMNPASFNVHKDKDCYRFVAYRNYKGQWSKSEMHFPVDQFTEVEYNTNASDFNEAYDRAMRIV